MKDHRLVVIFGVFDGIHDGHRNFFQQAREYGDQLLVVVGRDTSVLRLKGKPPRHPEVERLELVAQEQGVSRAVLGDAAESTYRVLEEFNPDGVCLGYDQQELKQDLEQWLRGKGVQIPIYSLKPYRPDVFHNSLLYKDQAE